MDGMTSSQPAGAGQPSPEALSLAKDINALPGNEIIPAAARYRFAAKEIDAYTATLRAELEAAKAECVALRACLTEACDVVDGVREGDTVDSFTAQPWRLALSRIPECYAHLDTVNREALRKAVEALTACEQYIRTSYEETLPVVPPDEPTDADWQVSNLCAQAEAALALLTKGTP
jgi:hypothetical protein